MGNCSAKSTDGKVILGLSVHYLSTTFYEEAKKHLSALGKDVSTAKIYDIENLSEPTGLIRNKGKDVHSKEDGRLGAAYIDCLEEEDDVGEATHMLSYSWGNKLTDILTALNGYCKNNNLKTKRTYIWICCLCNNQNRLKEMVEKGIYESVEEFERVFKEKVLRIGHILSLMVPWEAPVYITRVWCLFEFFTALQNKITLDVIMPKSEKDELVKAINGTDGPQKLLKTLSNTRIQDADASVKEDKTKILQLIESGTGFAYVNGKVNDRIRSWVQDTLVEAINNLIKDSKDVTKDLDLSLLYNQVGLVFDDDGQYDKAIEYYNESLLIKNKALGKDHLKSASLYNNLGHTYEKKQEHNNALKNHLQSLSIKKKKLGREHESTAISYNNIGLVYSKKGDVDKSLESHQKALAIRKRVLGKNHASTARSYNNLGAIYKKKKDHKKALNYYKKCLAIFEKEFGKDHPNTATAYNNIAFIYEETNQLDMAAEYMKKTLDIEEKVHGLNHPRTKNTRNSFERLNSKGRIEQLIL